MKLLFQLSSLSLYFLQVVCLPTVDEPETRTGWPEFVGSSLREHVRWVERNEELRPVLLLPYGAFEATSKRDKVYVNPGLMLVLR